MSGQTQSATAPLSILFSAIGAELDHWATTGETLQDLFGEAMAGRLTPDAAVREAQHLDHLVQHIHQLGAFCSALAASTAAPGADLGTVVRAAAADLVLGDLARRLRAEDAPPAQAPSPGDCELW